MARVGVREPVGQLVRRVAAPVERPRHEPLAQERGAQDGDVRAQGRPHAGLDPVRSDAALAAASPARPAASPAAQAHVDGPPSNLAWWISDTAAVVATSTSEASANGRTACGSPLVRRQSRPQREGEEDRRVGAREHGRERPRPHPHREAGRGRQHDAKPGEDRGLDDEHRTEAVPPGPGGAAQIEVPQDHGARDRLEHVGRRPRVGDAARRCTSASTTRSRSGAARSRRRSRPRRCACRPRGGPPPMRSGRSRRR